MHGYFYIKCIVCIKEVPRKIALIGKHGIEGKAFLARIEDKAVPVYSCGVFGIMAQDVTIVHSQDVKERKGAADVSLSVSPHL